MNSIFLLLFFFLGGGGRGEGGGGIDKHESQKCYDAIKNVLGYYGPHVINIL